MPLHVFTTGSGKDKGSSSISSSSSNSNSSSIASPSTLMTPSHRGLATSAAAPGEAVLLKDEYGNMDASGQTYVVPHFTTESGVAMRDVEVRYNTFGHLNEAKDNVLVVCHALTGNARLDTWWSSILGPGKAFDTDKYLVVCANILGSCYGTTGPTSLDPATGRPYGVRFPQVTIRDTVALHIRMLKEALGARSVACVVGGSLGGMQALEWVFLGNSNKIHSSNNNENEENFVRSAVVIACGARHTAWQIGISETQRQAIYADPLWRGGEFDHTRPPLQGLAVARQIAMFSYRTPHGFENKFGRAQAEDGRFEVRRYLEYQGQKFLSRFDALTYVRLTEKMDSHDVGRGRGGMEVALKGLRVPVLVLGIDSDVLYPLHEQEEMARLIPKGELRVVRSREGHDGFLLEQEQVGGAMKEFLKEHRL